VAKKVVKKKTLKKAVGKTVKKASKKTVKKAARKKTVKKAVKASPKKAVKKVVKKKTVKASPKKTVKKAVKKTVKKKAVIKKAVKKKAVKKKVQPAPVVVKPKAKLPKTHLSTAQLRKFRTILQAKRHELIGDMTGIEANTLGGNGNGASGDSHNMPTHPADVGSDNFEQEFTLGLIESERAMLGEIYEALERIDNKSFGVCCGTGKRIAMPRLNAVPWSKYSIDYQRMIEKGLVKPDDND